MIIPARQPQLAFISYRRDEDAALAGRIRDRLQVESPDWTVFMDVAGIDAGANFREVIDTALARASVMIVLIGRRWLGPDNTRIHEDTDFVRYEIATALRLGTRIIPV